jgi:hypothetical protein
MIEIFYDGKWRLFYPLSNLSYLIEDDYDNRPLINLPETISGKMFNGVCGSNPVYTYLTTKKSKLREINYSDNYPLYNSKYY